MKNLFIYIHYPFCVRKCPYCDFNSYACAQFNIDPKELLRAYKHQIDYYYNLVPDRQVQTIFFGGGTPSIALVEFIENIIRYIKGKWKCSSKLEISIEVNPGTIDKKKLKKYKKIGINRVSIGVQSLDNNELKFLGRIHSAEDALKVINDARELFDNVSADFIYALPNHNKNVWEKRLNEIIKLDLPHYSLYQLSVEKGTPFYKNKVKVLDEEKAANLFTLTRKFMKVNGVPAYEISNFAKPRFECMHNMAYWNGSDYIGIGAGAHGRLNIYGKFYAFEEEKDVSKWLQGDMRKLTLTEQEKTEELIITGLRTVKGVDIEKIEKKLNIDLMGRINWDKINNELKDFISFNNGILNLKEKGWPLLNKIVLEIL